MYAQTRELDSLNQFLEMHQDRDDSLVVVLARLSYLHNSSDTEKGLELGRKALELAREINHPEGISRSFNSLGVNYYARQEYDSAIVHYDSAVHYKQLIGDTRGAMITEVNIGVIEVLRKSYNQALQRYEKALAYFEETGEEGLMGAVLVNMGIVHKDMYASTEALRVYMKAKTLAEKSGNKNALSSALTNLGSIYQSLGQFSESMRMRRQALKIATESNDKRLQAILINGIGRIHDDRDEFDSARYYYQAAYDSADRIGLRSTKSISLMNMGNLLRREKKYNEAIDYLERALEIRREMGSLISQSTIYLNLGRTYSQMRESDLAMENFEKSLQLAQERNGLRNIASSSKAISQLYEERGELESAYKYYKMSMEAADSARDPSDLAQLSALASRYHTEKENEAALRKEAEEKAVLQSRLDREKMFRNLVLSGLTAVILLALIYYRFYCQKKKAHALLEEQNKLISEQKNALTVQAKELTEVNAQIQTLSEFRSALTHMIAHDMKNPLNAIIGLSAGPPSESRVKRIAASGYRMLNLVTNMLEVEKLEQTSIKPDLKEQKVSSLICDAQSQVEILLQAKSILFQNLVPDPVIMMADKEVMIRVLVNLFSNAIKYSDQGGVVRVRHDFTGNGKLRLLVEDEGRGINEARLPYIFDKFWQADRRKSGLAVSTGLGLTFCKLAVESHGGSIWAESEEGRGTCITIELDAVTQPVLETVADKACEETRQSLIVADELSILTSYSSKLKSLKVYQVGQINRVIRDMEQHQIGSRWKTDLLAAVFEGDQERFDELLEEIDMA